MDRLARIDLLRNGRRTSPDERGQTLAETGLRHLRHVSEAIEALE